VFDSHEIGTQTSLYNGIREVSTAYTAQNPAVDRPLCLMRVAFPLSNRIYRNVADANYASTCYAATLGRSRIDSNSLTSLQITGRRNGFLEKHGCTTQMNSDRLPSYIICTNQLIILQLAILYDNSVALLATLTMTITITITIYAISSSTHNNGLSGVSADAGLRAYDPDSRSTGAEQGTQLLLRDLLDFQNPGLAD
jgi:hypothetical protein